MGWGGKDQAKRREHADCCARRYGCFVWRTRMVTTVDGVLRSLEKNSVGDHRHKTSASVAPQTRHQPIYVGQRMCGCRSAYVGS